jgi:putative component of toxin-antitoxin plasmid stabilization module
MSYILLMHIEKTAEYSAWLDRLKDRAGRARILVRVDRLIDGNKSNQQEDIEAAIALAKNFRE